jgi:hypothetical protein
MNNSRKNPKAYYQFWTAGSKQYNTNSDWKGRLDKWNLRTKSKGQDVPMLSRHREKVVVQLYPYSTSAPDGVYDQRHAPTALPSVPFVQEAGWASGPVRKGPVKSRPH